MKKSILFSISMLCFTWAAAQCVSSPANVYSFTYKGKRYEVVKENKNWSDAAACALIRGGALAVIDDQAEQDSVYDEVLSNAGITLNRTVAGDGGGASYLWLGANDMASEGRWIWDGANFGSGVHFWQGAVGGMAIAGAYTNWGNEPDNFNNQDALGLALTDWPVGSGTLGKAGQWNDVDTLNRLYFIIEYPGLGTEDVGLNDWFIQTFQDFGSKQVSLKIQSPEIAANSSYGIEIHNALGSKVLQAVASGNYITTLENLSPGVYIISIIIDGERSTSKKLTIN